MKLSTEMTTRLNRAMKKSGRATSWKVEQIGSFLALSNSAEVKASEILPLADLSRPTSPPLSTSMP